MVGRKSKKSVRAAATAPARKRTKAAPPTLLSGGNPQIAKGDGDAPVQAYLAAMPGWKGDVGRRLDALRSQRWPAEDLGRDRQGLRRHP